MKKLGKAMFGDPMKKQKRAVARQAAEAEAALQAQQGSGGGGRGFLAFAEDALGQLTGRGS